MSEALNPCPFCNSNEHLAIEAVGSLLPDMPSRPYRVVCTHIDHDTVTGPTTYGRAAAVNTWNHRPAADRIEALEREASHWLQQARDNLKAGQDCLAKLEAAEADKARLSEALRNSIVALDDWLHTYAPEECKPEHVAETKRRLQAGGTLWYLAVIQEQNRAALGAGDGTE